MNLSEQFLYFLWQFRLFNTNNLYCAAGESLQILNPGILNKDAGPDFSHVRLRINDTLWAGNIEIHVRSSDWMLHNHQKDRSFESVILHVVYNHNQPIYRNDGSLIPVLVLKDLFSEHLLNTYHSMITSKEKFPCQQQIKDVNEIVVTSFLSRLMAERLEQKSAEVLKKLEHLKGDWDDTFYHFMARNFGFKVNAIPFELLAVSLPQQLFAKHKDNKQQIEALIYGQAGFLDAELTDEGYPNALKQEYAFLKKKYQLKPIDVSIWKFLRMRPQSFPTIRLAQFTALIINSNHLFSKILEIESLKGLYKLFEQLPVNEYWNTHYHFHKKTKKVNLQMGIPSVQNIIINTICLFIFTYGKYTDQPHFINRAIDFLEEMPPESNAIIDQYVNSGIKLHNASGAQALLQLNKYYCSQKKCLNCGIGIKILNK